MHVKPMLLIAPILQIGICETGDGLSTEKGDLHLKVSPSNKDTSSPNGSDINVHGGHELSQAAFELNLATNSEKAPVVDISAEASEKSESLFMKRLQSIATDYDNSRQDGSALKATNAWNSLFYPNGFGAKTETSEECLDIAKTDIYKAKK